MKTGYRVGDVMTVQPIVLTPKDSIRKCGEVMAKNHIGAVIIKEGVKGVGIVTEQNIMKKVIAKSADISKLTVGDVMETHIVTISPTEDIYDALVKMGDMNIRHLTVVEDGRMIGLLTQKDVLKIEPHLFDLIAEKIKIREEERKPINNLHEKEGICQTCGRYAEELEESDSTLVCKSCLKEGS